jgi:hypothetical protein
MLLPHRIRGLPQHCLQALGFVGPEQDCCAVLQSNDERLTSGDIVQPTLRRPVDPPPIQERDAQDLRPLNRGQRLCLAKQTEPNDRIISPQPSIVLLKSLS